MKGICVYCASSGRVDRVYFDIAAALGAVLARRGLPLVYGGGNVGLMGALAVAVHSHGGKVVGVIPEALRDREVAYLEADELIITRDLRERKAIMESRAIGFIALPGGFGTLEEILEVITLKQLRYHEKPVVFLNADGYFAPLLDFFDRIRAQGFATEESAQLYRVADDAEEAVAHIEQHARGAAAVRQTG